MTAPVIDINGNLIPIPTDVRVLTPDQDRRMGQEVAIGSKLAAVAAKLGSKQGRDVSSYDGAVDWSRLDFGINKVSQGSNFVSPGTATREAAIRRAGKIYGDYHYADPGNGAAQADFYLAVAGMPHDNDLPVSLDYEVSGLGVSFMLAFSNRYKLRVGCWPLLYTYVSMFRSELKGHLPAGMRKWLAHYGVTSPAEPCDIWQWQGGPDLDTAFTALSAMTVGASRKPIPVVTGPPGVYPFGPDGRKPTTSTHTVARNGDTWRTLTDRYFHGGATTSPKAIEQWHLTHGGDPRAARWQNLGTLTIILPVGSPGFLA